jgi:hypothetical protein
MLGGRCSSELFRPQTTSKTKKVTNSERTLRPAAARAGFSAGADAANCKRLVLGSNGTENSLKMQKCRTQNANAGQKMQDTKNAAKNAGQKCSKNAGQLRSSHGIGSKAGR